MFDFSVHFNSIIQRDIHVDDETLVLLSITTVSDLAYVSQWVYFFKQRTKMKKTVKMMWVLL